LFPGETETFTVHEIGCALGHFGDFLQERFPRAQFSGSEIYEPFVEKCRKRFPQGEFFLRDITETLPPDRYDYVFIGAGTFHIPGTAPRDQWESFIYSMLSAMYAMAKKGIGSTFLTGYADYE
jgi:Methyltransferase domain